MRPYLWFATVAASVWLGLSGQGRAETWIVPGAYTLKVDGWSRSAIPEGFNYRCLRCKEQIEIEIMYGPPLSASATWKNNAEFINALSTPEKRQTFADALMKSAVPADLGAKIEIKRVALEEIGGLRVLMMASEVTMGRAITLDTSMVGIQNNRLMRTSVHFFEGAMNAANREAINAFMSGLVFVK